jgi:hypothetical protein
VDAVGKLVPFPHLGHKRPDLTAKPLRFQTVRNQGFTLHSGAALDITDTWEFIVEDTPRVAKSILDRAYLVQKENRRRTEALVDASIPAVAENTFS